MIGLPLEERKVKGSWKNREWKRVPKVGSSGKETIYGTKPLTRAMSGVPYAEQSQKTKENDVIMILSSLAYIIPIRLLLCISTDERESF